MALQLLHSTQIINIELYFLGLMWAIQVVGGGRVSDFPEKYVTKMYGSTLLALRGGGWVSNFQEKSVM